MWHYKGALVWRNLGYCAGFSIVLPNGEHACALSFDYALDVIDFLS